LFLVFGIMLVLWHFLGRRSYIATTTLGLLEPVLSRPSIIRRLPRLLLGLAMVMLIIASMDPVIPMAEQTVESQGLDIAIVLDLSESMRELMDRENLPEQEPDRGVETMTMEQEGPTRLETTKGALRQFISERRDDRIAMVVFADNAYIISPLTMDHDFLLHYLDMIDANILRNEKKTAIGEGIALANNLLMRQRGPERRGQVIMAYTDGEHNYGRDPLETLSHSYQNGIKVHLVGVDVEQRLLEKENVQLLIESVREYGGRFFAAETRDALAAASSEIDSMEKGRVVTREYLQQVPVYKWFAISAAVLILFAFLLRTQSFFSNYS
jgi:Ca-activated chloride channel family protein